jgi:hypothetical protein
MKPPTTMDVELVGGALDGTETTVPRNAPDFDVYLFRRMDEAGRREVLAYAFHGSRTLCGGRWVLQFLYAVARVVEPKGGAHE